MTQDPFDALREQMVQVIAIYAHYSSEKLGKDAFDERVMEVLGEVPRHEFVPLELRAYAYADGPLPIGYEKTISQPFMVALMTDLAEIEDGMRVLEVGTGLGYHAAVLAALGAQVYSIEIIPQLGERSKKLLAKLNYGNIRVRIGDGYKGWPEEAPFDAIIVTAAPPQVPQPLLDQLKVGGRMIIPVGEFNQGLVLINRTAKGYERRNVLPVRFVPMTGEAQKKSLRDKP